MAEIVTCPACARTLQVPEDFFGKTVQCPECKQMFEARATGAAPAAAPQDQYAPTNDLFPAGLRSRSEQELDDDERDRPHRRRPADDDDQDDERPRRRRLEAHRGGMILVFGILAIVGVASIPFGPLAWILGNADLKAMRAGRMDPSGESQTNLGRILGMISTLLIVVSLVLGCVFFVFMVLLGITGVGGHRH
jgi:hypothetical protein